MDWPLVGSTRIDYTVPPTAALLMRPRDGSGCPVKSLILLVHANVARDIRRVAMRAAALATAAKISKPLYMRAPLVHRKIK